MNRYTWTATNSICSLDTLEGRRINQRLLKQAEAIAQADDAAERLTALFAEKTVKEDAGDKRCSKEAAAKLVSNHEAVAKDCTRDDPQSQQHIIRGTTSDAADVMLRYVTSLRMQSNTISYIKLYILDPTWR